MRTPACRGCDVHSAGGVFRTVGTMNTIVHTPHTAHAPTTQLAHSGKRPERMLSETTVTMSSTVKIFTGLRMPRCSSQSRSNRPNAGVRRSHL